jgi:hypothetical protein
VDLNLEAEASTNSSFRQTTHKTRTTHLKTKPPPRPPPAAAGLGKDTLNQAAGKADSKTAIANATSFEGRSRLPDRMGQPQKAAIVSISEQLRRRGSENPFIFLAVENHQRGRVSDFAPIGPRVFWRGATGRLQNPAFKASKNCFPNGASFEKIAELSVNYTKSWLTISESPRAKQRRLSASSQSAPAMHGERGGTGGRTRTDTPCGNRF